LPSPPPFSPSVASTSAASSIRSGPSPVTSLKRLAPMAPPPLSPPPTEPLPPLPKTGAVHVHGANVAVSSPLRTYSPLPGLPASLAGAPAAAGGPSSSSSSPARPSPPTRSVSQPRAPHKGAVAAMNRHKARSSSAHLDGEPVETMASSTSRTELAAVLMHQERY
jgi:hypothetical protein